MLSFDINLTSERLRLRPITLDDIPFVFDASRYEGFCDGMRWDPPETQEELIAPYESNIQAWKDGVAYTFTIERLTDSTPVGRICIRQIEESLWDFGFWTHPQHYGQGFMTEAVQTLMNFSFTELGITEFQASHATWNLASRRVLEKCGFQFLRHEKGVFEKSGKPVDEDVLSIRRDIYINKWT